MKNRGELLVETDPHRDLAAELARLGVAAVAPQELPMFPLLQDAYRADPKRALTGRDSSGGPLEFGAETVIMLVTPVALTVATQAVQDVVAELVRQAGAKGTRMARRLFGMDGTPAAISQGTESQVVLTADQCAELHRSARDTAVAYGIADAQATLLADAIVGRLANTRITDGREDD